MKALSLVLAAIAIPAAAAPKALNNPERGFRFEIHVGIEPDEPEPSYLRNNWPFAAYQADGISVAQAYCYLTRYCDSPIPQSKLDAIQASFDRARADGVKFLLRFAYETDTSRTKGPTLDRILSHIAELTPIVRRNIDVIYSLQTGWVGAWGEFHGSVSRIEFDKEATAKVVKATLDMLPEGRFTMMRTMQQRENALSVLGKDCGSRIGFFNDATLADFHDSGTFVGDRDALAKLSLQGMLYRRYAAPGNPQFDEVCQIGVHLPVDGELFWNGHVDLAAQSGLSAIVRMRRHHYTTFSLVHGNSELDKKPVYGAIDAWKSSPVTSEFLDAYGIPHDREYFAGVPFRTAFDYIRDHLGYRIAAMSCKVGGGKAKVTLHNYGFAAPINPRKAYFAVVSPDGNVSEIPLDFDCRSIAPETDTVLEGDIPPLDGGRRLALWLPDMSETLKRRREYAISLSGGANVEDVGGYRLNVLSPSRAD